MPPEHPRLLMLKSEESALKTRISSDSAVASLHKLLLKECDDIITETPVEEKLIGKRLLKNAREFRRRVFFLSYAWRISRNKKYLSRAESELLTVAAFSSWNPSHFLDVAEITMGMAIGYDWLFNDLSPATRTKLKAAIIDKGLKPGLDPVYTSWLKETHNWNQVCNSGLTFGALAVFESDPKLARQIIDRAIPSVDLAMKEYEPDGAYREGYGYWNYGTTFNVLFVSALEKALGKAYVPTCGKGFMNTGYYLLNMVGNSGQSFNYSDGDPKPLLNPAMFWFAWKMNDPNMLYQEIKILKTSKHLHRTRELPMVMIWGSNFKWPGTAATPKSLQWIGQGKNPVALMRSSWDKQGIFVGFKAGSPSEPHGHMDVGSFVIDALGERWAIDFENQDYNSLEQKGIRLFSMKQTSQRWELLRASNKGHNTLTFDNELQQVAGYAKIESATSGPNFISAISDITQVYQPRVQKATRGVSIIDKKMVGIRDEIEGGNMNSTIRWTMVTPAQVTIKDSNTATLMLNGKTMILEVEEPASVQLKTWSTVPVNKFEEGNPGTTFIGFEVNLPKKRNVALSVLLIPEVKQQSKARSTGKEKVLPRLSEWSKIK